MYFKKYGKFFVLSISCMFLIACGKSSTTAETATKPEEQIRTVPPPPYTVFKKEVVSENKIVLHVRLQDRITRAQLYAIAKELNQQRHHKSVPVFFYLPEDPKIFWANVYLEKIDDLTDLKDSLLTFDVIGSTKEQHDQVAALDPQIQGQVVGIWHAAYGKTPKKGQQDKKEPADYKIVIEKIGNKTVVRYLFADGTVRQQDIKVIKQNGKIRYMTAVGEQYHESYQINKQGDLEFWCYDNLYYTAPKIQP